MTLAINHINNRNDTVVTRFPRSSVVMEITPDIATDMLTCNINNRKLRPSVVIQYASDMQMGRWHPDADSPIVFDWDGRLINGQHRLHACIKADTPFVARVNRGVDPAAYDVMDQGFKRQAGDALTNHGISYGNETAATYRLVHAYHTQTIYVSGKTLKAAVTSGQVLEGVIAEQELFHQACAMGKRLYGIRRYARSATAALYVLAIHSGYGSELVEEFMEGLASGANMREGDPRLAFARWWVNTHQRTNFAILAALIRAFNAYVNNQELKLIKINTTGGFPRID